MACFTFLPRILSGVPAHPPRMVVVFFKQNNVGFLGESAVQTFPTETVPHLASKGRHAILGNLDLQKMRPDVANGWWDIFKKSSALLRLEDHPI